MWAESHGASEMIERETSAAVVRTDWAGEQVHHTPEEVDPGAARHNIHCSSSLRACRVSCIHEPHARALRSLGRKGWNKA